MLICNYYNNYLKYQTGSKKILLLYEKNTLVLPIDNHILNLVNFCYTPDLSFKFIHTIQLGKKYVWDVDTNYLSSYPNLVL